MSDVTAFAALLLAFAVCLTSHVAIAYGLALRPPRWRALLALVIPPLAPFFALRERMRVRAVLWIASLLAYVIARRFAG